MDILITNSQSKIWSGIMMLALLVGTWLIFMVRQKTSLEIFGTKLRGTEELNNVQASTKWVPQPRIITVIIDINMAKNNGMPIEQSHKMLSN
jgi:hypothetical protein